MRTAMFLLTGLMLSACSLTGLGPGNNSDLSPDQPGRLKLTKPGYSLPVLSPDGRALAFLGPSPEARAAQSQAGRELYLLDLAPASGKDLGQVDPAYYEIAWVHENRSLFLSGNYQTNPELGGHETIWLSPLLLNLESRTQRELSDTSISGMQIPISRPGQASFYLLLGNVFRQISYNQPDKNLPPIQGRLLAYRLSDDGEQLQILSQNAADPPDKVTIAGYNPAKDSFETLFQLQGPIANSSAEFSPDGIRAVVKTTDPKRLILLELAGKSHEFLDSPVDVRTLKWSPDSRHLLIEGPDALYLYSLASPGFRRLAPASILSERWHWHSDSQQVLVMSNQRRLISYGLDGSSRVLAELPADSPRLFSEMAQLAGGWIAIEVQNQDVMRKDAYAIRLIQPGSGKDESLDLGCQAGNSIRDARAQWRGPALAPGLAWHCPETGIMVWKPEAGLRQYRELDLN